MAEGSSNMDDGVRTEREEVFSKSVRAGKRTYFFDVKTTRRNDYYLTLTESKKRFNRDGRFYFEKHKIFLYKEDFEKFTDGLTEAIEYIRQNAPEIIEHQPDTDSSGPKPESVGKSGDSPESIPRDESTEEVASIKEKNEEEIVAAAEAKAASGEETADDIAEESFTNVEFEDLEDSKA